MKNIDCFVAMPFSGSENNERDTSYWNEFYNLFLIKIFEEPFEVSGIDVLCKINISRHTGLNGYILDEIIPKLSKADILLVILTDLKANVIYELGLRHAIRHGTILACKKTNSSNVDKNLSNISGSFIIHYEDYDIPAFRDEIGKILKSKGLPLLWKDSKVREYLDLIKRTEPAQSTTYTKLENKFRFSDNLNLSILWMDNFSETVAPIIAFLLTKSCKITFAVSTSHFKQYAEANVYDLIISDMREGEDENEGIQLFSSVSKGGNLNNATPFIIFAGPNSMKKYKDDAIKSGLLDINLIEDPIVLVYRLIDISNKK